MFVCMYPLCESKFLTQTSMTIQHILLYPDDINITDLNILPHTLTACSIVVQWSRPFSDPLCGTVWYTVTISSEGRDMIITDNTTMTSYDVTGLNDNTVYHVSVTASNNAGISSLTSTMTTMTNSIGKCIRTLRLTGFNY